jgi:hypothetical protein
LPFALCIAHTPLLGSQTGPLPSKGAITLNVSDQKIKNITSKIQTKKKSFKKYQMKLFLNLVTRLYWAVDYPGSTYSLSELCLISIRRAEYQTCVLAESSEVKKN